MKAESCCKIDKIMQISMENADCENGYRSIGETVCGVSIIWN